jgi:hypothetical protein
VHHAVRVGVGHRVRYLAEDAHRLADRELSVLVEPVAQRLAAQVRHDVVQQPVVRAGRDDRQDVGVLEVLGQLDLALEARRRHLADELGGKELHHDPAPLGALGRQEETAHPAPLELALEAVRITQRDLQALQQVGHGVGSEVGIQ